MTNDLTLVDHAIRYASLGWHIIPVEGKRPIGNEWQKRASSDQAAVARLFAQSPMADGIGVCLGEKSGLIDFDCDSKEAEDTFFRLFKNSAEFNIHNPVSFKSKRGRHFLFRWTNKLPQGKIKIVVDGLEIRLGNGDAGCQSVFPPSGDREWIVDPDTGRLFDVPDIVIDRINARYAELNKPKTFAPAPASNVSYETKDGLNVPKWLAKHGVPILGEAQGGDGATRWFIPCPGLAAHSTNNSLRDCCVTQTPDGKLGGGCFHSSCGMNSWQSLRDAIGPLTYDDYNEPVTDVPDCGMIDDEPETTVSAPMATEPIDLESLPVIEENEAPAPVSPDAMGEVYYQIPGLIGEMIQYHRDYAPRPRPELSLVASIALVGAITGRKIKTKSGLRTNIYCVGLAKSGSGKDEPRVNNTLALAHAGLSRYMGSESPASDSALITELADNPSLLLQIDEVSHFFKSFKGDGNANNHLKNIKKVLLELVGAASSPAWSPKSWADKQKRKVIAHPNLCMYGTATTNGFWGSVTTEDAVDGFLARMMIVEAAIDYPRLRDRVETPTPQPVIDILKDWHTFDAGNGEYADDCPTAVTVHFDSAAEDRIRSHSEGIEDRLNDEPDDRQAIWARASALAKKLALIFAASRGPFGIVVTLEDAIAAVRLANWCTRLLIRRVFTHISANESDREKKRVLDIIRSAGSITATGLNRKTQWLKDGRSRRELITELLDAAYIEEVKGKGRNNKSILSYRSLA